MEAKSFKDMECSVARSLERVGEWWNMLILRDSMHGIKRFDGFHKSLGIAPNTLTRRLNGLVEEGLLEKRRYSEHPPRDEYILTLKGRDFLPVIAALLAWGNKHFSPNGIDTMIINKDTKEPMDPMIVDRLSGNEIHLDAIQFCAGPASSPRKVEHYTALGLTSRR